MTTQELLDSLKSVECPACKGRKQTRQSFCRMCYARLPAALQKGLYRRIGQGYEAAFDDACWWLARFRETGELSTLTEVINRPRTAAASDPADAWEDSRLKGELS